MRLIDEGNCAAKCMPHYLEFMSSLRIGVETSYLLIHIVPANNQGFLQIIDILQGCLALPPFRKANISRISYSRLTTASSFGVSV